MSSQELLFTDINNEQSVNIQGGRIIPRPPFPRPPFPRPPFPRPPFPFPFPWIRK